MLRQDLIIQYHVQAIPTTQISIAFCVYGVMQWIFISCHPRTYVVWIIDRVNFKCLENNTWDRILTHITPIYWTHGPFYDFILYHFSSYDLPDKMTPYFGRNEISAMNVYSYIHWCHRTISFINKDVKYKSLHWRHNGHYCVSNYQPHDCLSNRLFRRRSKKTSKIRVTGLCAGTSPGPVNSPQKESVTRKMFPFDDVIMLWLKMGSVNKGT